MDQVGNRRVLIEGDNPPVADAGADRTQLVKSQPRV